MSAPGFNLENKSCSGLMKYAGFDHRRRRRGPWRELDTAETFNQLNNSTADTWYSEETFTDFHRIERSMINDYLTCPTHVHQ